MSGEFCGIDPQGLATLAIGLDWAQADIDGNAGKAYDRLNRHARWSIADGLGTKLSAASRWCRDERDDMRRRVEAIIAAQQVEIYGPLPPPFAGPGHPLGTTTAAQGLPWDEIEDWVRGALGIWNGGEDADFPTGRWITGLLYVNRTRKYLAGTNIFPLVVNGRTWSNTFNLVPSISNGLGPRTLSGTRYFSWLRNPAVQVVGRRASVVLSAYSTYQDAVVVWNHGNPLDAFEEHGAGYVADVARLGFSASTTAFLVAPNPITGGLVIVTGVVWAGAELVDHWDEVSDFFGDVGGAIGDAGVWVYDETGELVQGGWNWTTGQWNDFEGWAGEQWNEIEDWGHSRIDDLQRAADWADDRLDDAHEWANGHLEDLQDFGDDAIDFGEDLIEGAGEKLGDAKDWTSDRIDDLADVGGDLIDSGGDLIDSGGDLIGSGVDKLKGWFGS